jgi:phosphoglucosamine mutase
MRLFGTDGVRGVANEDLSPELVFRLGRAAAHVLSVERSTHGSEAQGDDRAASPHAPLRVPGARFLIGRDTRLSGPMLEAALVAAICSTGGTAIRAGIIPTPAVAYLAHAADAVGVAISASHNPVEDNGLKFFGADGFKLPDAVEEAIELAVSRSDLRRPTGEGVGTVEELADAAERYVGYILDLAVASAAGLRVVVDCAYGAATSVASALWERLGATIIAINDTPDGARINVGCGSTSPNVVAQAVLDHGADVGFAHDGDADRVIAVDETGQVIDGDAIMGLCAMHLHAEGRLPGDVVVATVMSNLGLELALRGRGIRLERTRVGDRYVLERMRELGARLGGEQSGHVIFLDHATTGDGFITAIQVANVMLRTGRRLSELAAPIGRYPQVLKNVRITARDGVLDHPVVRAVVADAERRLADRGRILVRLSGTEPLVRVMVEAEDAAQAEALASEIIEIIMRTLGAPPT